MKPKEYEANVLITEATDFDPIKNRFDTKMIRLLHAGLGMSSELAELVEAVADPKNGFVDWVNVMEEASDLAWYTAVATNALGFDHDEISKFETNNDAPVIKYSEKSAEAVIATTAWVVGNYNDLLKKSLFYGRELDLVKMKQTLQQMCASISGLCRVSGYTIEHARETNIKKLRARYGEKFTEAAALNRNLETERKVLEGETK